MNAAGLETLIMNIYRNVDLEKFHFDFAVHTTKECFYDKEILLKGGRIISHPLPRKNIKKYKMALANTLKNFGPYDVVHSHTLFFSGIVLEVSRKYGVPTRIAHSHNTKDGKSDSIINSLYRSMMRFKISTNSTNMIGCSQEACEFLFGKKNVKNEKTIYLPNSIDLNTYKQSTKNENYLREKLLIDKDSFLIGHVGRFTAQKNHEFLIKIFNEYCKKNNRLPHLVLVGEGNEENKIRDLVKQLNIADNVHFLGVRSDINKILNSIDLFLFPSLYEGLGIVLIEAQAAGVACLVSNEVPKEADLDIDLIHRLDLSESEKIWAEKIEEIQKRNKAIEWDVIEEALIEKKYEINSTVKVVTDLYEHNK